MPYALRVAGWSGLLVILSATAITCYTAKSLVWCFNTLNDAKLAATVETYDDLVERCFGRFGAVGMKAMTVVELFGGTVCMVVLHVANWPTLLGLPPSISLPSALPTGFGTFIDTLDTRATVACVMCACALPTLLIDSRFLSVFAACGLGATALLFSAACAMPFLYVATGPSERQSLPPPLEEARSGPGRGAGRRRSLRVSRALSSTPPTVRATRWATAYCTSMGSA
jgi:hypothetical protein